MSSSLVRCFWAVRPPDENLEQVSQLVRTLKRPAADLGLKVSWVPTESYHLTLKFLGDVAEERIGEMITHVESQLAGVKLAAAPKLELKGLGVFPGVHRPQVLFVDTREVSGRGPAAAEPVSGELAAVQAGLERWLTPLGFTPESRPFHPHLTVGRVRSASAQLATERRAALPALLQRHAATAGGPPFAVEELILYESQPTSAGPKYTPLVRLPLIPTSHRAGPAS